MRDSNLPTESDRKWKYWRLYLYCDHKLPSSRNLENITYGHDLHMRLCIRYCSYIYGWHCHVCLILPNRLESVSRTKLSDVVHTFINVRFFGY